MALFLSVLHWQELGVAPEFDVGLWCLMEQRLGHLKISR